MLLFICVHGQKKWHRFDLGQDLVLKAAEKAWSQPKSDSEGGKVIQLLLCFSGLNGFNMTEVWGIDEDCSLVSRCCRLHTHTRPPDLQWDMEMKRSMVNSFVFSLVSSEPEMNASHNTNEIKWIAAQAFEGTSTSSCWSQTPSDYPTRLVMSVKPDSLALSFFPLRLIWKRKILCDFVNSGGGTYSVAS